MKHGHCVAGKQSPTYHSWVGMKTRCLDVSNKAYLKYGGRGIRMHSQWVDSFESFLAYMGPKPTKLHSIDRIDNNGNYEPGNVRWALPVVQQRNKSTSKLSSNDVAFIRYWVGAGHSTASIAEAFGVSASLVSHIKSGRLWSQT